MATTFRLLHPRNPHPTCPCPAAVRTVLADRGDGTVVRHGDTVAKAHAPDTDRTALARRIAVAAHPALHGVLLPPLDLPRTELDGRPVTFWPHGTPVDPEHPEAAPWEAAGTLLARLHAIPAHQLPGPLPPMRGPAKVAQAITRMRRAVRNTKPRTEPATKPRTTGTALPTELRTTGTAPPTEPQTSRTAARAATPAHPEATAVERAWANLPPWARAESPMPPAPRALCHGDLHLGQLVRHPAAPVDGWLLIDVDDLGLGVPSWDLARPAAWYATGLLPPEDWARFVDAYRAAHGPALPATGDPWPALDVPARALTVQTAALAIAKAAEAGRALDEVEQDLIAACDRMAALAPELAPDLPK
ncbi:phosphotransferase family protein [Streptomyces sp. NPDC002851]